MVTNIYINLPVKNLEKSRDFFTSLGFTFNEQFSDEKAAGMVIGPNMYSMLLTEPFFQTFTKKPIADAHVSTEALVALEVGSKAEVDGLFEKALAAGGSETRDTQDLGFMYSRSFHDLDGHVWEVFWMDKSNFPPT